MNNQLVVPADRFGKYVMPTGGTVMFARFSKVMPPLIWALKPESSSHPIDPPKDSFTPVVYDTACEFAAGLGWVTVGGACKVGCGGVGLRP